MQGARKAARKAAHKAELRSLEEEQEFVLDVELRAKCVRESPAPAKEPVPRLWQQHRFG